MNLCEASYHKIIIGLRIETGNVLRDNYPIKKQNTSMNFQHSEQIPQLKAGISRQTAGGDFLAEGITSPVYRMSVLTRIIIMRIKC